MKTEKTLLLFRYFGWEPNEPFGGFIYLENLKFHVDTEARRCCKLLEHAGVKVGKKDGSIRVIGFVDPARDISYVLIQNLHDECFPESFWELYPMLELEEK